MADVPATDPYMIGA